MELYPRGQKSRSEDDVALFLNLKNEIPKVKIKYSFAIINAEETEEISHSCTYTFCEVGGYGYPQFIKREELFSKAASLLPNNTLTIMCKVF